MPEAPLRDERVQAPAEAPRDRSASSGRRTLRCCGATTAIQWEGPRAASVTRFVFDAVTESAQDLPSVEFRLEENDAGRLRLCQGDAPVCEDTRVGAVAGALADAASSALSLHSRNGLLLHAAALGWKELGILIPGPSGAGKTTLAAWLTGAGFDYVADDLSFVPEQTRRLEGFARPLRLRDGSDAALRSRPAGWPPPGESLMYDRARVVSATAFPRPLETPNLAVLLFAAHDKTADGRLISVSRARTAFLLMGSLLNAGNIDSRGFEAVAELATSTAAFEIRYRDCRQVEIALREWRASLARCSS